MPLNNRILDKIKEIYAVASQISKYWVHIDYYYCFPKKCSVLKVVVYTFVDGIYATLFDSREMILTNELEEDTLQYAIDKIKELIKPTTNEND